MIDAIELDGVPLVNREAYILKKINYLRMDCINTYYDPVKNTMTNGAEQQIGFGLKGTYRLREVVESPGNRAMYYLSGGPERAFVSEELMLIPEDTELPPDYVQAW